MSAILDSIVKKLDSAQKKLVRAAEAIPADLWQTPPREGAWSAAEVIAHVMMVERTVIAGASRVLKNPPKQIPLLKRFRLPFAVAEMRLVSMKSPIVLDPQLLREKEGMLAELQTVRRHTLEMMEKTRERDLRAYRWRHPFLGSLNAYDWFAFLAAHQIRHEKQMREVASRLPKVISSLQK